MPTSPASAPATDRPLRRAGALALAAALGLAPAAGAEPRALGPAAAAIASGVAEAMSVHGLGRAAPAALYVRPPFDGRHGVVCPALSRRLERAVRAALRPALDAKRLTRADVVRRQGTGAGQATLMLSWRAGPKSVEIAWELGDFSTPAIADIGGAAVRLDLAALDSADRACLAPMQVLNRTRTAEETLYVHRAPDIFSQEIGVIEPGERFRLLGRMPYAEGEWAVVRLPDTTGLDRYAERIGFATVPGLDMPRPGPDPERNAVPSRTPPPAQEIEVVSGRTTPVCAEGAPLKVRVVRRASGFAQAVRWIPPGATASIGVAAGETIRLSPGCTLRLVRTARKLDFIAIFEELP